MSSIKKYAGILSLIFRAGPSPALPAAPTTPASSASSVYVFLSRFSRVEPALAPPRTQSHTYADV